MPFAVVLFSATLLNAFSGIARLTVSKRLISFVAFAAIAEMVVRIRASDRIFYSIPTLPDPELET